VNVLNRIPLASVVFVLYAVASSIAVLVDEITFNAYTEGLLYVGVGLGVIGYVRNQAGHGVSQ
jgi:hypothetical protein